MFSGHPHALIILSPYTMIILKWRSTIFLFEYFLDLNIEFKYWIKMWKFNFEPVFRN